MPLVADLEGRMAIWRNREPSNSSRPLIPSRALKWRAV